MRKLQREFGALNGTLRGASCGQVNDYTLSRENNGIDWLSDTVCVHLQTQKMKIYVTFYVLHHYFLTTCPDYISFFLFLNASFLAYQR